MCCLVQMKQTSCSFVSLWTYAKDGIKEEALGKGLVKI